MNQVDSKPLSRNRSRCIAAVLLLAAAAVASCGGGGGGAPSNPAVTPNASPAFTSAATTSTPENQVVAYVATATDPNTGDSLTFSISGGDDAGQFSISSSSGELSFSTGPDFENPSDVASDNVYRVDLTVNDGRGGTATQSVEISVTDVSTLELNVTFPTPNAELGGNATQITVAGTIQDVEDDEILPADLQFIDVNGVTASRNMLDPSRWSAVIPIVGPGTDITVSARPGVGADLAIDFSITNQVDIHVNYTAVDTASNRAFVSTNNGVVIGVDLTTGLRTVLSGDGVGSGPALSDILNMEVDPVNSQLVVFAGRTAVFTVDLDTGDRAVLSSETVGSGVTQFGLWGLDFDSANNRILVTDQANHAVIAIDMTTGHRTILSDQNTGTGDPMFNPEAIAVDAANGRAFIIDWTTLFSVDLATGDRTVISNDFANSGPNIGSSRDMIYDAANDRTLVPADNPASIIAVDMATGDRTFVSDENIGGGPEFLAPVSLAWETSTGNVIVGDQGRVALMKAELTTGNREILSSNAVGAGDVYMFYDAIDVATDAVYSGQERGANDGLYRVDTNSGDRTTISNGNIGGGATLPDIRSLDYIEPDNRVVWFGTGPIGNFSIISIDVPTGDRTLLSNAATGTGPDLTQLSAADANSDGTRAVAIDGFLDAVLEIDLVSGDRTIVADLLYGAVDLAFDVQNNRALVIDLNDNALVDVDLATGDKVVLSGGFMGVGSGPGMDAPYGIDFDETTGLVYVSNRGDSTVMCIDVTTGARTIISGDSVGEGPPLDLGGPIRIDRAHNRIFVSGNEQPYSLKVIDLDTGDRVISAR